MMSFSSELFAKLELSLTPRWNSRRPRTFPTRRTLEVTHCLRLRIVGIVDEDGLAAAGFHPKRSEKVFLVQFDEWEQQIAVPAVNLVELSPEDEIDEADDEDGAES